MDKQDDALHQHQSPKPWDGGVELLRPNHEHQIPTANQSESARCHAQPIIQHAVVRDRLSAQPLQRLGSRGPAEENTNNRYAPRKSGKTEEQSQKSKVHRSLTDSFPN